jgi:Leucine-rich repeat (LRR) protein
LGDLRELRTLNLAGNALVTLPPGIYDLPLKYLNVAANKLREVSPLIIRLGSTLQDLSLGANQITVLPPAIGALPRLRRLWLQHNNLRFLPEAIGKLGLLETLACFSNQLGTLPRRIGQLKSLSELDLSDNRLEALPQSIGQLYALQELSVQGNRLSTFPQNIGYLQSLETLYAGANRLEYIPWSVGNLQNLRSLFLEDNRLVELPASLGNLRVLIHLELLKNPLLERNPWALFQVYVTAHHAGHTALANLCIHTLRPEFVPLYEAFATLYGEHPEYPRLYKTLAVAPEAVWALCPAEHLRAALTHLAAGDSAVLRLVQLFHDHTPHLVVDPFHAFYEAASPAEREKLHELRAWLAAQRLFETPDGDITL